ncbi:hypothetical protein O181_069426 [Austropuccinia psidii MF-1]|uniref:Uncharacterized protein n=1 Tax=Austropuccinia psidii MF-1 TaxID=1389203 RepID=A0A9Q3EWR8_9BASI|nr:hypothetical protein [Austropuccinia psidii MF-1]
MNVNFQYLENIELLTKVYNHYVHWYVAQRYKKEIKEPGKYAKEQERKAVLRYRLRLKDVRYKFGVAQGFPNRYLKILAEPEAHSDDEYDPISKKWMIKKIECRSQKATIFMRRVDEEIAKSENPDGKGATKRERHIPEDSDAMVTKSIPKGLPIDFYDPDWFNDRTAGQKRNADTFKIAFLPDASKSLLGKPHPDERLSDKRFTDKYWAEAIQEYDISHEIFNDDELDDSLSQESDDLEYLAEENDDENAVSNDSNDNQEEEINYIADQDTEMEYAEDNSTPQQSQQSFISFQNDWNEW